MSNVKNHLFQSQIMNINCVLKLVRLNIIEHDVYVAIKIKLWIFKIVLKIISKYKDKIVNHKLYFHLIFTTVSVTVFLAMFT